VFGKPLYWDAMARINMTNPRVKMTNPRLL
jgi:hypothetical protein